MGAIESVPRGSSGIAVANASANATDIARATIRQLAERRLAPTPSNYAAIYAELSGDLVSVTLGAGPFLRQLGADLAKVCTPSQFSNIEKAMATLDPELARSAIVELVGAGKGDDKWGELIRDLIRSWDVRSPEWTQARKRESLEHVATAFGADGDKLASRLRALVKSWSARGADARSARLTEDLPAETGPAMRAREGGAETANATAVAKDSTGSPPPAAGPLPSPVVARPVQGESARQANEVCTLLRDLSIDLLRLAVGEGASGDERLIAQSGKLIQSLRAASEPAELAAQAPKVRMLMRRAEQVRGSQRDMMQSLLGLLHLIVSNIEELVPDERWVKGQVERLRSLIADPLDGGSLAEAEKAFREIIVKQSSIKQGIREAHGAMKDMLSSFIGRLSSMSESTGQYQSKVESYTVRIRSAEDIGSLSAVVQMLLEDTRLAQADILRSRDELLEAQSRARQYEEQVAKLERELSDVSSLLREDPLTGVLNRRGLAEAFSVETARSDRMEKPLCAALLDVDNFKKLNDTHGHDAGDRALQHLADIVREAIRPTDVVARFGGEEFVVLMPQTDGEEAVQIMTRVQRHLTRGFFLSGNQKMLITFSAGVTRRALDEDQATVLARADQALYEAKATGKNKVIFI
jgi:diguanylate cyclase